MHASVTPTVLITGGAGQLGSALIEELRDSCELIVADTTVNDNSIDNLMIRCMDITRMTEVRRVIDEFQPDVIINTAAYTNVDGCEKNPDLAWAVNSGGVENLTEAAPDAHFVQISTDYVFDGYSGPYSELDKVNPLSEYGQSKLAAEGFLSRRGNCLIIRPNVLYGADWSAPSSFPGWVKRSLEKGDPIKVVTDQICNPTYTVHLVKAIHRLLEHRAEGLFHYGSQELISRYDFSLLIADVYNLNRELISPILTRELQQLAPRPLRSGLCTEKIEAEHQIEVYHLAETLEEIRNLAEPS